MKYIALITLFFILSCSKDKLLKPEDCKSCLLVSYKYSSGWELVRIDTLWKDENVCGKELDKVIAFKQIDTIGKYNCPPITTGVQYEILKYFIK